MRKDDKNKTGLSEIRRIIRNEIATLLEAEVKKVDLKGKMRDVLNMSEEEFEQEYGTVYGAEYALKNFEEFKKWLSKQSNLDSPTTTKSGGVDIKSAISTFKELPSVKTLFGRDMSDKGSLGNDKKDYNKGAISLREIGKMLQDNGVDVDASNPSSVRNYLGRKIDMPIIKKAMDRTGKKYRIDMIKLVFDPGFTSWLSSQFKVVHEDKQKDWELFLYGTVGKQLHKEITKGELERFNTQEFKSKVNAALHNYMKTDSELKEIFDEEHSSYYEEVEPTDFDVKEFLHSWFLNDVDDHDRKQKNLEALNGAYETIVDMLDSEDESLFSSRKNKEEESEDEENISEQIYESLKKKKLVLK